MRQSKKLISLEGKQSAAKKIRDTAQKEVDAKELELKELDAKIKEKREAQKSTSNQKEYNGLKVEIDSAQKVQNRAETDIVGLWNKFETAKREHETKAEILSNELTELTNQISEADKKLDQLEKKVSKLKSDRSKKEEGVPAEWQEKYQHMHGQVPNPVAESIGGACSQCFHLVTSQGLIDLKKKKLMECKGCYRFLYLKEAFNLTETEIFNEQTD